MIYDLTKVPGDNSINSTVLYVRQFGANAPINNSIKDTIRKLIPYMSIETCEKILNQSFELAWVPWKNFNGLTLNQLADMTTFRPQSLGVHLKGFESDYERVSSKSLFDLATTSVTTGSSKRANKRTFFFANGTRLNVGYSCFLLNPRAVVWVLSSIAIQNRACAALMQNLLKAICYNEDWFIPIKAKPGIMATEPMLAQVATVPETKVDPAKPVMKARKPRKVVELPKYETIQAVAKKSKQPATAIVKPIKPATKPKPGSKRKAEPALDNVPEVLTLFLNALKPGTEIRIVVPA